jgi:hypothetical protein
MGIEPCRDLADALAAEPARLASGAVVPSGVCPKVIALRHRASYVPQLRRFLEVFGPARVKLLLFDDFQANPTRSFHEVCRFLEVRHDFLPSCRAHNVGRQVKNANWHEFLTRAPRWATVMARMLMPSQAARNRLQRFLVRKNQSVARPAPLTQELRAQLRKDFSGDVEELARITGWDLRHW